MRGFTFNPPQGPTMTFFIFLLACAAAASTGILFKPRRLV